MLSYQTVEPHTLELLKSLADEPMLASMRLVGGTALALQYGHRNSIDLDFFGSISADAEEVKQVLRRHGTLEVIKETRSIMLYRLDGVKVDMVHYQYPWIDDAVKTDGLSLASPKDIAAMKVNAIEGRGTKKDFIDLYFLLKHYSIEEILGFYKEKYPEHSVFRALMSMSYFEDADEQFMPLMFESVTWEEMRKTILEKVRGYAHGK
ncbi:MAG: nucleotidyl transferase AbiEii/AbiGii toxin family protein [Bacteroidaceae bacterium]|nr:nucleotidyl transferase AbiEii/AbiGii toxin family protein [Bacteroidaceae bacterium]